MASMKVLSSPEFEQWYLKTPLREQAQIDSRVSRIEENDYLGDWKYLGEGLAELRWKNGRRVYFTKLDGRIVLLLVGGYKNAQKKDIKKARLLLRRYADSEGEE